MIASHSPPFVQIHIPRTGGTAWSLALWERFPNATIDLQHRKHSTWKQVVKHRGIVGNEWKGLVWCVVRPPHEIVESWWCNVATWWRDIGQHHPKFAGPYTLDWLQYCARLKLMDFEEWFDHDVMGGKFNAVAGVEGHWLSGVENCRGTEVVLYRFDELGAAWNDLCDRLGVDPEPAPASAAKGDDRLRPTLTSRQRVDLERMCADDYRLADELPSMQR